MILNDKLLEPQAIEEDTPLDAPPSYEASGSAPPAPATFGDSKRPPPIPVASGSSFASSSSSSSGLKSAPPSTSWFNFANPTVRQVRTTVLGLVRDLVKLQPSDHSVVAISILKSCADAAATHGLSMSNILQEKSVEGHTPLYWAIVKRPSESQPEEQEANGSTDLLTTLLSLSVPLTAATMSDVRLACLLMLLDATIPPDIISVENVSGGEEGAFIMDFAVVRFQKRMLVSKSVVLDFIARSRMWRLSFNVSTAEHRRPHLPPAGTWYASLSLLGEFPADVVPPPPESAIEPPGEPGFASGLFGPGKPRTRPTLSVRMKATEQLRAPGRGPSHRNRVITVTAGLGSLQYAGCPYIASDETLRGRLEARLAKPEADCIIC
ncbi:hypothetical protein C8R46DRAFT_1070451 [Mycena filopes]|nr:hypothetical protein C8R46DRAFT_1070451 [Mycena filopes]